MTNGTAAIFDLLLRTLYASRSDKFQRDTAVDHQLVFCGRYFHSLLADALFKEQARTELAKAGQQRGSVAAVANALGFGRLGRFARDYERRFGELPSQTLCRGSTREVR